MGSTIKMVSTAAKTCADIRCKINFEKRHIDIALDFINRNKKNYTQFNNGKIKSIIENETKHY